MAYKGNGAHKIAPMYEAFELPWSQAVIGDLIVDRSNGMWDRIREFTETGCTTTHDKEYKVEEIMLLRY